ncbi:MAG: hypothetical protein KR126chlam1_00692 [Chlamydiae bacterium]|nr:hypothetical protein [Chlamydiota bacterium]
MRSVLLTVFLFFSTGLCAFHPTIPVLNLPDYYDESKKEAFLEKLEEALKEVGFFALTGSGVAPEILDRVYAQSERFFSHDTDTKLLLSEKDGCRGYVLSVSPKGEETIDYKEYFQCGRDFSEKKLKRFGYKRNLWPEGMQEFRLAFGNLFSALDKCKTVIGSAFEEIIGLKKNRINKMIRKGDAILSARHYFPNPPPNATWAEEHTDNCLFTILVRPTGPGLQVLNKNGEWIDVLVPDGAFVVNSGDKMENLTNGYFRSSFHRVIDHGIRTDRTSLVFFVHPRHEDRLDPFPSCIAKTGGIRKYPNVTSLELIAQSIIEFDQASPDLMEFFVESGAIERLEEVGRFSPKAKEILIREGLLLRKKL